jgi:hypothetical protein
MREEKNPLPPPNTCRLTFREPPIEQEQRESTETLLEQRTRSLQVERNEIQFDWMFYDGATCYPLLPSRDDLIPLIRAPGESEESFKTRLSARYCQPNYYDDCAYAGLRMDMPLEEQHSNCILRAQPNSADTLIGLRKMSTHCSPLCYKRMRTTIFKWMRAALSMETLFADATKGFSDNLETVDYEAPPLSRVEDVVAETKEWLKNHKLNPTADALQDDIEVSMKLIQVRADALYGHVIYCTGAEDCTCLSTTFIRHRVSTIYSMRAMPRPTAPIYQHLGDAVWSVESPSMCETVAVNSLANLRFLDAGRRQDWNDTFFDTYEFDIAKVREDKRLLRAMRKHLGPFAIRAQSNGELRFESLVAPSSLLINSFRTFMNWHLAAHSKPGDRRPKPFGNVFGATLNFSYADALVHLRRMYPAIADKCHGLSDYVYYLGWYNNAEIYNSIRDYMTPFVDVLVKLGLANGQKEIDRMRTYANETNGEPILGVDAERRLFSELGVTQNFRLVLARISAFYWSSAITLNDMISLSATCLLIVPISKLCVAIAEYLRASALRDLDEISEREKKDREQKERLRVDARKRQVRVAAEKIKKIVEKNVRRNSKDNRRAKSADVDASIVTFSSESQSPSTNDDDDDDDDDNNNGDNEHENDQSLSEPVSECQSLPPSPTTVLSVPVARPESPAAHNHQPPPLRQLSPVSRPFSPILQPAQRTPSLLDWVKVRTGVDMLGKSIWNTIEVN